ncbi:MAG: 4Fe-4S cluster-binding domain-containing protein [Defluviitaleaceae bacterium]|nr:4Fe-4S cluster-binding domain-containing protein [Defluviitaleaceae bacterium]
MLEKMAKKVVKSSFAVRSYLAFRRIFSLVDDAIRKKLNKKPVLYLLEYHMAEHCNMNCKNCFHFSPLVKTETFPSLKQFKCDIVRLSEIFGNIKTIRLMGGEPLLNKELPHFIYTTRKAFPRANIHLLSNGLLYKKVEGDLLAAIKSHNVVIHISLYKPMIPKRDEMARYFTANGVEHWISDPILHFAKYINIDGTSNPKKAVRQCPASRCVFLSNGKLARCPLPFNIKHFNEYFNQSINMENELIDIHTQGLDGFELKKKLIQPMQSCRYCGKLEWRDWEQINPPISAGGENIRIEDFCISRLTD